MKTDTIIETTIETDPIQRSAYSFDPEHTRHIAEMLRDNYSDPHMAVVREYSANATDAHVLAGIPERPIEVYLPTTEDLTFKVRDFGHGLSVNEARKLLFGYGSSGEHKRQSDDFIGGFGIGAKCALAVCDQFSYTIWHQGRKYIWNSFLDGQGDAQADLIYDEPSDEPSGIEVSVPVQEDELSVWTTKVQAAFEFYNVSPIVHQGLQLMVLPKFKAPDSFPLRRLSDSVMWTVRGSADSTPMLVMGGIGYPIDFDTLYAKSDEVRPALNGFVLFAPVGFVKLAPSREALRYNRSGKERLKELLTPLLPDQMEATLMSSLESDGSLDKATELQKAKLLYMLGKYTTRVSSYQSNGGLSKLPKFKGISTQGLQLVYDTSSGWTDTFESPLVRRYTLVHRYSYGLGNGQSYNWVAMNDPLYRQRYTDKETTYIVPPCPATQDFRVYRIPALDNSYESKLNYLAYQRLNNVHNGQIVFIHVPEELWDDARKKSPWLDEVPEITKAELDTLVIPDGALYSDTQINNRGHVVVAKPKEKKERNKIAQHSASCFSLKATPENSQTGSDHWDVVNLKDRNVLKDEPLILIDRFSPQSMRLGTVSNHMGLSVAYLRGLLKLRPSLFAGKTGKLYAVRVQDADKEKQYAMKPWVDVVFRQLHNNVWQKASPLERDLLVSVLHGEPADNAVMNLLGTDLGNSVNVSVLKALSDGEQERVNSAVLNALVNGWSDPKVAEAAGAGQKRWLLKSDAGRVLQHLAKYAQLVNLNQYRLDKNDALQAWFDALPSQWDKDVQATLLLLTELQGTHCEEVKIYRLLSGDDKAENLPSTSLLQDELRAAASSMLDSVPHLATMLQTAWYAGGVAGSDHGNDCVLQDNRDLTRGFATGTIREQTRALLLGLLSKQTKKRKKST